VSRPQVIDDTEHERIYEQVAAIDVAEDTGMVCTRTPHPSRPGSRRATVWTIKARMGAVRALGRRLRQAVQLVSASQAKNLPGRPKTDLLTELPPVSAAQQA